MKNIYVTDNEWFIIKNILKTYSNIIFFGSRITGTHKQFSDLDICIKDSISDYEYELLKEKFENSDLPFTVDIVDYKRIDDSFKKIIDQNGIKFLK